MAIRRIAIPWQIIVAGVRLPDAEGNPLKNGEGICGTILTRDTLIADHDE